jgi:hypothetical protein
MEVLLQRQLQQHWNQHPNQLLVLVLVLALQLQWLVRRLRWPLLLVLLQLPPPQLRPPAGTG